MSFTFRSDRETLEKRTVKVIQLVASTESGVHAIKLINGNSANLRLVLSPGLQQKYSLIKMEIYSSAMLTF